MAFADVMEDAEALIDSGDYSAARTLLADHLESASKNNIGRINYMIGECDFHLGDFSDARKHLAAAKAKNIPEASLLLGRIAFLDYDFDDAASLYNAYTAAAKKAKKEVSDDLDSYEQQLSDADSFLERVEKIVIIDSIAVPRDDFFKAYRIPASSGSLRAGDEFPIDSKREDIDYFFTNEGNDFMMWAETDSLGFNRINEAIRLTDGSWSKPVATPDELAGDADSAYPFMMADGVTLYYAADGEGSIGGYDIFVASRDATTGEYLQPQNIGMPYNSPYDDYLLAIDELNGIGWWATDRNRLGDKLTVYVYLVNDLRKNYDPDDERIVEAARIDSFKNTQDPDADYSDILATIAAIDPDKKAKKADFHFPMPGGKIFTTFDDFSSETAKSMMKKYLAASSRLESDLADLTSMRKQYHSSRSESLKRQILELEKKTEKERAELKKIKSDVYRAAK